MKNSIVGRVTDGFFRYQGWPSITKAANGVLYVASSGHRLGHVCPFGKDYLYISRDDGNSWDGPIVANDTYMDDRDAGLCAWGDGNLLLSWFSKSKEFMDGRAPSTPTLRSPMALAARELWKTLPEGQYDPGAFIRLSEDGGKTWGEKIRVPVTAPHGPIYRKDGSLLFLGKVYLWEKDEDNLDGQIWAVESRDGGHTWQKIGEVPDPEGVVRTDIHEPHAVELPDGTLLGGIRVHEPDGITIYLTRSTDGGKSWEMPVPTGICGAPPHFLLHSSGAVVMVYGRRRRPCGQRAKISYDGGKTWSEEIVIGPESPDWDCGYPASAELSDGSILTVYYQKYTGDTYNSILSTRWELPKED